MSGGGENWGAGLDYLVKPCWHDLDRLVDDNLHKRHNLKLINALFVKLQLACEQALPEMDRLCFQKGLGFDDWVKKARSIIDFGHKTATTSDKVVFINTAVQFLRSTTWNDSGFQVQTKPQMKRRKKIVGQVVSCPNQICRGTVKLVLKPSDVDRVTNTDILVTVKTKPDYLPAMVKAKAYVTDVGGMLCHAAITAREYSKPCIVGTSCATGVFKDGDIIELNLFTGGVAKI